jgi:hypothetical protein
MATTKMISKNICDETYFGLSHVKDKIVALRNHLIRDYAAEGKMLTVYERHLSELVDQIDWKLQIMSHSCSYDWKGSEEYDERGDNTVSVGPAEKTGEEFSPGYLGG